MPAGRIGSGPVNSLRSAGRAERRTGGYGDGWNAVPGTVRGLFYGGGWGQLWAELIGVTTCFVTLSALSLLVYYIAEKLVGNRVERDVEIEGLDVPEMGVPGYSGMVMDKQAETPMIKGDTLAPNGPKAKSMVPA